MSVPIATEEFGADAAIISQEGLRQPTTDLMRLPGSGEAGRQDRYHHNEDAGTDGMSESLPDVVTEANAIVSTGNSNATILLPKMDRVLGELKEVERVTGGNVDSIKPTARCCWRSTVSWADIICRVTPICPPPLFDEGEGKNEENFVLYQPVLRSDRRRGYGVCRASAL